jgi:hypothetical protein
MRRSRKLAVLGAAGALGTPTAIALADEPAGSAADLPAPAATPLHARLADDPTVRSQMRDHQHERLLRAYRRAADKPSADARVWSNGRLRREIARARAPRQSTAGGGYAGGRLAAIRACESGGDYSTNTGNGFYGAYQFTQASWEAVGGTGNPAAAGPAEQDRRAAMLMARSGAGNWPVCGGA